MQNRLRFELIPCTATLVLTLFAVEVQGAGPTAEDAEALIDSSISTLGRFLDDKGLQGFRESLRDAKAVIIVPRVVAAGLILGGSGGKCTALARYGNSDKWSQPWFCNVASVGLQIGTDVREAVVLVMTEMGMQAVMTSEALDQHAKYREGGSSGAEADVLMFTRQTEGSSAGRSLTGAYLFPADGYNNAYYGKTVTARAVFERKEVYNRDASELVSLVTRYGKVRGR